MHKLKFDQPIAATAAKPIGVHDLLKRLKTLSSELESLEQEHVERNSLTKVASQLASPNLLQHKNKGVTAYTSCCIADLLRLCAPDAPFSQAQLKVIFDCFIKQLKGLGDIEGTYFQQYYYLLESLASVESVVLLGDVEKSDQLTLELFRSFFDTVTDRQRRQNVEEHMVSIMTQLIDELPQLPAEVLDVLLAQLLRSGKNGRFTSSQDSPAYTMAKSVFNACADRLQRNICQYFTEIIFDASQDKPEDDEQEHRDDQLKIAHSLVYELFVSAPTTLQNVIPQLESELNVENSMYRLLATQTISGMLSSPNGGIILQQYSSTYKAWASRRNDKNVAIRAKWIEGIGQIMVNPAGAVRLADVEQLCIDGLITRLVDPDERVRSTACKVIEGLDYTTAKARLTSGVLKTYSDRCRDKKPSAQEAAFRHIGKLFGWAYADIASGNRQATDKFAPLVNYILHCLYVNDMGINTLLERTLYEDLLECEEGDDATRARRALQVLKLADERSRRAFFAIVGSLQKSTAEVLEQYLKCCDKFNGGVMDEHETLITERLKEVSTQLARRFPDTAAAQSDLMLFAKNNDRRAYKLIRECISPANDHKTVRKMMKDSLKRLGQMSAQVATTFTIILTRASFQFLNRSIVPSVSKAGREDPENFEEVAELVLREISIVHPTVYKTHITPLTAELVEDPLSVPTNTLKALASFARSYPDDIPDDVRFNDAMKLILQQGSPEQAKQAVTIVCSKSQKPSYLQDFLFDIAENLAYGNDYFLTQLAVIAQVNLISPDVLEERANQITAFCAKELLTKNRLIRSEDDADEWIDDEFVPEECTAKCFAIRILGNRLRAYHAAETAAELARPVFKALRSIIVNMGELSPREETPLSSRSRIRLEASKMVLKLAAFSVYEQMISPDDFTQVALFAQDLEYRVRKAFLARLQKSLASQSLTSRWYAIMFLAAHDPEEEIKSEINRRIKYFAAQHRNKDFLMESMIPRLIHLLAHHPDFMADDRDDDDLVNFSIYFCFYFDTIVTAENLVLIYHYCQRIKQVADAVSQDSKNAENIYILADIAEVIFSTKADQHHWPRQAYPKKLKLPTDLYRAQTSTHEANSNQNHSFLSDEQRDTIKLRVLKINRPARPSKAKTNEDDPTTPKKRPKNSKTSSKKRSKRELGSTTPPTSVRRSSARQKKVVDYANPSTDESEGAYSSLDSSSDDDDE